MAAAHSLGTTLLDQESQPAQLPNGSAAAVLGIGTANSANCLGQDECANWYFRVTKSDHLTTLNNKMKRICTSDGYNKNFNPSKILIRICTAVTTPACFRYVVSTHAGEKSGIKKRDLRFSDLFWKKFRSQPNFGPISDLIR